MAISQIGAPEQVTPAYNPVWYYFDSTNKNEPGFRYVIDLYVNGVFANRYRIAPRPSDGYCALNISKVLQSYLTNQLPTDGHATDPTRSYVEYELEVGEEYDVSWEYSDYEFFSDPASVYNAYTQLRNFDSPAIAHSFVIGDQVNVDQDGSPLYPAIDGLHTVVLVPDAYTIVIDLPFPGSGPVNPGVVEFADNSKTQFLNLLNVIDVWAFNGALSHADFPSYDLVDISIDTVNLGRMLTSCPYNFTVRPTSYLSFNAWSGGSNRLYHLYGQNDAGTIRRRQVYNASIDFNWNPVGPGNIDLTTLISGSGQLVTSATKWYEVWFTDQFGTRTSQIYRFNIDRTCARDTEYEACFLDRMGSLGSFTFIYRSELQMRVDRSDQKFLLGDLSGGKWTYSSTDAGSKTVNVDASETITLRTAWLTDDDSLYFRELVSSPVTYIRDVNAGLFYPYVCATDSITVEKRSNNKAMRYTVTFRAANNNLVNW